MRFHLAAALVLVGCGSPQRGATDRDVESDGGPPRGALDSTVPMLAGDGGDVPDPSDCTLELLNNGFDDDCDGVVDEGSSCAVGRIADCFRGAPDTVGVGQCRFGTMTCEGSVEFGAWGPCEGDIVAGAEVCDALGVDEDCDGTGNEDCACTESDPPRSCGSSIGACEAGTQSCVDGTWTECEGSVGPGADTTCNGIDDDCDELVDEGITRDCGTDEGTCYLGSQTCIAGEWDECAGEGEPTAEICDGADNDCDGSADEGLSRGCGSDTGACSMGSQSCVLGSWRECEGVVLPSVESCNDVDDDCDGPVDESLSRSCGTDVGICETGTETCRAGAWGSCEGATTAGTEVCDGLLDEDCDDAVDEGCLCTDGSTRPCGSDIGLCEPGTQSCSAGGWGACLGAIGPQTEECDGADNDCDRAIDEDGVCPTAPPVVTCPGDIVADVLSTVDLVGMGSDPDGGSVGYSWTVTSRPPGSVSTPASPSGSSTTFFLDASGGFNVEFCVTDDEGERACCTVAITSTPPGAIHVEYSWNTAYGDVDGHLLNQTRTPDDGWFTTDDCYFGNPNPDWGPVGINGSPTLDRDDRNGYGPENTTIEQNPVTGRYHIGAHYYCAHSLPGTPGETVSSGEGPTEVTIRVYCDGSLIATYERIALSATDDWITVARVDYPSCVGRSVDTRTNGSSILPSSFTAPAHCEISCSRDADCPDGERCVSVHGGGPPRLICWL